MQDGYATLVPGIRIRDRTNNLCLSGGGGGLLGTKGSDTQTLGLVSQILAGGNFLPFKAVALWAWGGQRHKEAGSPGLWRWCVFLDGCL